MKECTMSIEIKKKIESCLQAFLTDNLTQNALNLFNTLGYNTDRQASLDKPYFPAFKAAYAQGSAKFNEEKALVKDWKYVDLLFQLSKDEVTRQNSLFDTKRVDNKDIQSYLFFTIELSGNTYSRTVLAQITREVNKLFPMPAMVLFKTGNNLTFSIINRRLHKKDENKDVLEKVTLIKDISIENPHRAHIEILFDLSFDELLAQYNFTNFVELHDSWQKTLDTKELNKRFYLELSNWYFWAMQNVSFPSDIEKEESIRNATNLIRLITRVIFVWFIKEKDLVPEIIFKESEVKKILKDFSHNKTSNSFYRAILQNLFFATLNQKMTDRRFTEDHGGYVKKDHGVKTLFRYKGLFAINEKDVLSLFSKVPFLNGGLFDCLDKDDPESGKHLFVDGFTRNADKQADLPDFLFFSNEQEIDLNVTYGTKNKKYIVKGLIKILDAYKFTVAENTPIEEEVALDPELLGKVFENLLASYNPETKSTARKQTGSFYTPREIVNYMVDESLKAYLKQTLVDKLKFKSEDADTSLDILFSYTEKEHAFSENECKGLIEAIDNCNILDPACGSGAFPMGILHKLVHILHKLDPQNEQWKERQINKAHLLEDAAIREQTIESTKTAFEQNELDYGRKLFLIENCIYGVDIQPIAVQIAKLRFFISLVVDQRKHENKENLGIKSLPNLETKFVAANTLIGLEKPEAQTNLFENVEITALEIKLKELRHRYFGARTRKEKQACQKEDKVLRQKIAKLLEQDGWKHETAKQIVAFDPYDQNASSPFFDTEWMFGLKPESGSTGVFDIVLGNPPYGAEYSVSDKKHFLKRYVSTKTIPGIQKGSLDTFTIFIEQGFNSLRMNGNLAFIVPMAITSSDAMTGLHRILEANCPVIRISSYSNRPKQIFDNACIRTSILFFIKTGEENESIYTTRMIRRKYNDELDDLISKLQFVNSKAIKLRGRYPKISTNFELAILQKIFANGMPLSQIYDNNGKPIYYRTSGGRYFNVITSYPTGSTKEKALIIDKILSDFVGATLSSDLFYFYQQVYTNGLDLKSFELDVFPIPQVPSDILSKINNIYNRYLEDIESNVVQHGTKSSSSFFKEYKIFKSKSIIDSLTELICPLYSLTGKEIDFIKNYELEYRLNEDAEE